MELTKICFSTNIPLWNISNLCLFLIPLTAKMKSLILNCGIMIRIFTLIFKFMKIIKKYNFKNHPRNYCNTYVKTSKAIGNIQLWLQWIKYLRCVFAKLIEKFFECSIGGNMFYFCAFLSNLYAHVTVVPKTKNKKKSKTNYNVSIWW